MFAAKKFGVTEFYNASELEKSIEEVLKEKTEGGCDYTFECVGNPTVAQSAVESCRMGGGLCTFIGVPPVGQNICIAPYQMLFGRILMGGLLGGRYKSLAPWFLILLR